MVNYKSLILNTHSKYWSTQAMEELHRNNKENGLNLYNFGGNALFGSVELLKDNTVRLRNQIQEGSLSTTDLLGVSFCRESYSSCASYRIQRMDHPLFEGINQLTLGDKSLLDGNGLSIVDVKSDRIDLGIPNYKYQLNGSGASGWECDQLVQPSIDCLEVIARGSNIVGGADLVYRAKKGKSGGIFSASSVSFTGSLWVDPNIEKLVWNVLTSN
jgi:hypothetical protein